jgi:predicted nucleic acid-binding protein
LRVFVDTSAWFAAANARDSHNADARRVFARITVPVTTDHVLVETWGLLNTRVGHSAAEQYWTNIRRGVADLERVTAADLDAAWEIGRSYEDQFFSIVDRTSFVVMERLGIKHVATFDRDFLIYRYGKARDRAFDVLR